MANGSDEDEVEEDEEDADDEEVMISPDADPRNADWIGRDGAYDDDPNYNPPYRPDHRATPPKSPDPS